MKIVEAKVGVIGGKLGHSVGNAHQRWTERKSVLIVLRDEEGRIGLGEAAPLPGYSPDTLEECERELVTFVGSVSESSSPSAGQFKSKAARFGVETALVDLRSMSYGRSAVEFYPLSKRPAQLHRTGLVDGDPGSWLDQLKTLRELQLATFKFKVGRPGRFEEEVASLSRLREQVPGDWAMRLDANGAWSLTEARQNIEVLRSINVEFVEQPCPVGVLPSLGRTHVPWAADESLQDPEEAWQIKRSACSVFVQKPTVLGGGKRVMNQLGRPDAAFIISHSFEGPVAMTANCCVALAHNTRSLAAGLDTHDALSAWPEMPIPQLQTPGLITPAREPGLGFTREQREEIASWIS